MAFASVPESAKATLKPFKVAIPEDQIEELHSLIQAAKLAPRTYESSQQNRQYGVTYDWMKTTKSTWLNDFDWRKHEKRINSFPHFILPVKNEDGNKYDIHFVALFSKKKDAVPLMLLHGWPGSFLEFLPLLQELQSKYTPETLPYHVIVPSLPGYAFSSRPPLEKNFALKDASYLLNEVMLSLGFGDGYVVQGGDIGSRLSRVMSVLYPSCKAVHLNYCRVIDPPNPQVENELDDIEREGIERHRAFKRSGAAYALEHGTRTSTIGFVLSSSPLALLAWIGEKFLEWTDEDPPLETILESITLYWLTETFPTAIYPYRESQDLNAVDTHANPQWHIKKPFGFSYFPREITPSPRSWIAQTGNLVFFRRHSKGGHFAALEQPKVMLQDIEDFIAQVWSGRE
ncbi:alpha/beta-hydrolase [Xylona heveae TC161]|uniref:Alpha/beta-hydrolase n=1 Tax=Xylona heveae (strain CBS 132557 / TC161) TaxID=1328760 RepID=A0A165IRJ7_XYLHT|nr:alpha/beta-hydrolase [Xylona heveae TC161]KZF25282.1 alpha/beta-hydrolase [Xylona heveae TC161]